MKSLRFFLTTVFVVMAFGLFAPVGLAQVNNPPATATVTPGGMPAAPNALEQRATLRPKSPIRCILPSAWKASRARAM